MKEAKFFPSHWVSSENKDVVEENEIFKKRNYFLNHDDFKIDISISKDHKENKKSMYFETDFGCIIINDSIKFFEDASGIIYDDDMPVPTDCWFRVALMNCPECFKNLWGHLIPCEEVAIEKKIALGLKLINGFSGFSTTIFFSKEFLPDFLSSNNFEAKKEEGSDDLEAKKYTFDVNILESIVPSKKLHSFNEGDVIIPSKFIYDEDGVGSMNIFNKKITLKIVNAESKPVLQVVDIFDQPENEHSLYSGKII